MIFENMTWRCEVCGQERADAEISVLTYPLDGIPGAERNLKYCKNYYDCYKKAMLKAATRKI